MELTEREQFIEEQGKRIGQLEWAVGRLTEILEASNLSLTYGDQKTVKRIAELMEESKHGA